MRAVLGSLAGVLLGLAPTPALAAEGDAFVNDDCHELIATLPVPAERLAGQVPSRFRLAVTAGAVNVVVRAATCERLGVGGRDLRPGLVAQLSVEIASPDGGQNVDGFPCCSWYILFWVTNSRDVASWLRQGTGLGAKIQYVEDLSLRYDRVAGGRYLFHAGAPTPSPFDIAAVAAVPGPPDHQIEFAYWSEKDGGAVKVHGTHETLRLGTAAGEVLAQPGSALARLIGEQAAFGPDPVASNSIRSGSELKDFLLCGEQCFAPPASLAGIGAEGL